MPTDVRGQDSGLIEVVLYRVLNPREDLLLILVNRFSTIYDENCAADG